MNHFERIVANEIEGIAGSLIVGVSGGADSVALLRMLKALNRDCLVVTCNFGLRGEESDGDSQFVTKLCNDLGVECITAEMDVAGYIARHGGSEEMACRELRYELFRRLKAQRKASRIAVAHNADDNIETFFLNLMRGAGAEGLKGMVADNGEIIRPLLSLSRSSIEEYLHSIGQNWRTDSTNLENKYRRNFIRNQVLPLLESRWPQARQSILRSQRNLRGEAAVIHKAVMPDTPHFLAWDTIDNSGDPRTSVQRFIARLNPPSSMIGEITAVAQRRTSGRVWLISETEIHSERDGLHIVDGDQPLKLPEYHWVSVDNTPLIRELMLHSRSNDICFLSGDRTEFTFRFTKEGDKISPLGMMGSKLISDILSEAKLTRKERRETVVLTDSKGQIVWIDGLKRSRFHLIKSDTDKIHIVSRNKSLLAPFLNL